MQIWQGDLTNSFDEVQVDQLCLDLSFPEPAEITLIDDLEYDINTAINHGYIDADAIASLLLKQRSVILRNPGVVARILERIGYSADSLRMRLQKAVNASIQEMFLEKFFTELNLDFKRNSTGIYDGNADVGTDFSVYNIYPDKPLNIEAKMYLSTSSMETVAKNSIKTFHNADLVCCYILTDSAHWCWLYKDKANIYRPLNRMPKFITKPMQELTTCKCIAGSAKNPWELKLFS